MLAATMIKFSQANHQIHRLEVKEALALKMFEDNPYKSEQIPDIALKSVNKDMVTLYRVGQLELIPFFGRDQVYDLNQPFFSIWNVCRGSRRYQSGTHDLFVRPHRTLLHNGGELLNAWADPYSRRSFEKWKGIFRWGLIPSPIQLWPPLLRDLASDDWKR